MSSTAAARLQTLRMISLAATGATATLALATRTRGVQRWDDALERTMSRRRPRLVRAASIGTLPGENYMHPTLGAVMARTMP